METWRVISIDPETKRRFVATFDTEEQAKKSIERNGLNPFTTLRFKGDSTTLDDLEKEGFAILSHLLYS